MDIKRRLVKCCLEQIEGRLQDINLAIQQAQEAIENETKSSAGDKYETSREMIQQDLNRYHMQLAQLKKDWILLQQMTVEIKEKAEIGAIVVTDQTAYFIAVSVGKQQIEGIDFMVISSASPIGKLLLGLKEGAPFSFKGATQRITTVY